MRRFWTYGRQPLSYRITEVSPVTRANRENYRGAPWRIGLLFQSFNHVQVSQYPKRAICIALATLSVGKRNGLSKTCFFGWVNPLQQSAPASNRINAVDARCRRRRLVGDQGRSVFGPFGQY